MPKGGHNAKPAELRVLHGNPGRRPIPKVPTSTNLTEHPPESLGREGKAEWRRVTKAWSRQGVFKEQDRAAFLAYCHVWEAYIGYFRRGEIPPGTLMQQFTQLISRLGLSPVDRVRLAVKEEAPQSDGIASLLEESKRHKRGAG